jgi:hypothetical protein
LDFSKFFHSEDGIKFRKKGPLQTHNWIPIEILEYPGTSESTMKKSKLLETRAIETLKKWWLLDPIKPIDEICIKFNDQLLS